ncbi:DUF3422 domain-containing protein [Paracoccus sp. TK19116]|uniref:DUF3422 domain-containing protein n=1 Tax=Paracoccus albicereus TaxID=2922394 RepID=A0ABT1MQJ6_9RHOB|nr:DUF3422 domain-containing protein [Paracoccus albicereus]MCQ0969979.1 DUF3422 domain-containing protein [Paracoccus albicereus]
MIESEIDHPLRYALVNELHARPSPQLPVPCTVAFVAFKEPRDAANRDRAADHAHLAELVQRHGGKRPDPADSHYAGQLGRYDLRWESHTEFMAYAATNPGKAARPFDPQAAAIFAEEWQGRAPGKRIASVLVHVAELPDNPDDVMDPLDDWFAADSLAAVWVVQEAALVAGDFRIDANGWMRFAVFVRKGASPARVGRIVQRLLELEVYRAMSMLGFQRVRSLSQRLNRLEPRLTAVIDTMSDPESQPEAVLDELLSISTELEAEAMGHSFRFGASQAYRALVHDRIEALRETRFAGRQMLSEFMRRRYEPAMRTVTSAEARIRTMLERAGRAGELLRTRVDVERSAQNQALLTSMDRRADLQLRLQHTVEGLSVVAISYYAVGLLSYALYPLSHTVGIDKAMLTALVTPLAVLGVWWALRRIRRRLH